MSQTIRGRLALADEQNRRALSQRLLRAGEVREAANDANVESLRSMGMLVRAIVFALVCIFAGVIALDYATDGRAFGSPAPASIGRVG